MRSQLSVCVCVCVFRSLACEECIVFVVCVCEECLTAGAFNQRKNTLEPGQNQVLAKTKRNLPTPTRRAMRAQLRVPSRTPPHHHLQNETRSAHVSSCGGGCGGGGGVAWCMRFLRDFHATRHGTRSLTSAAAGRALWLAPRECRPARTSDTASEGSLGHCHPSERTQPVGKLRRPPCWSTESRTSCGSRS